MSTDPKEVFTPIITTARLTLRLYRTADVEPFVQLFQDPHATRFIGNAKNKNSTDALRGIVPHILANVYPQRRFAAWAIERDGAYAGHTQIKRYNSESTGASMSSGWEIGYFLSPEHWGQGLGTEVAEAVTEYGFGTLGLHRVYAVSEKKNKASIALLEKIGFRLVTEKVEEGVDMCIYEKTRPE